MSSVSVIIPSYNRSGLVNETVRNVLSQSLPPFEVIVIDDGSTDGSVESLREEFGTRIQLIQQCNQGPGAARNAGLKIATGEFVWLMDSDDLASLNKLQTQVAALKSSASDIVYSPWVKAAIQNNKIVTLDRVLQQKALPQSHNVLYWFVNRWSNVLQQCLIRRELIVKSGNFRTDLWCGEDAEFFVRLLIAGGKLIYDDAALLVYRDNNQDKLSCSNQLLRRHVHWAESLLAMHDLVSSDAVGVNVVGMGFYLRVSDALRTLMPFEDQCRETVEKCKRVICAYRYRAMISLYRTYRRVSTGVQSRICGTSWDRTLQPARIKFRQRQLLEEAGLELPTAEN
jgi:glycosyltransferase involved in cell wall biosynthesis